jgi:hypothetical protein
MKTCTKCGSEGPFQKDSTRKDGFHPWCNACKGVGQTRRSRKSWLKRKYKLTEELWEIQFQSQGKRCAICRTDTPGGKGWATDHNHSTGEFRGILCQLCNQGIGCLRENLLVLQAAIAYLTK